jgi:hypothetical protein
LKKKGVDQFQEIISNRLHDHSFFCIIFDMAFDSHCTCLKSYMGLGASAWFFACLVISSFCLASLVFSLHCTISRPPPLFNFQVNPLHLWLAFTSNRDHTFYCFHGGEQIASHDVIRNAFASITKDARFHILHEQTHVFSSLVF